MTKKVVGKDPRQDSDETVPAEQFRVDRVFGGPPRRESIPNMRDAVPPPAAGTRRPATLPPLSTGSEAGDTELALRRQLSRLQRQLSDAQRELANKDEELASATEKRVELAKQYEETVSRLRDTQAEIDDLKDVKALAIGIEQRLQDAVAAADELNHQLERERSERAAIATQLEQTNTTLDKARVGWKDETALAEQVHAQELEKAEQTRRAAIEAAEAAKDAAIERLKQAHEEEVDELRVAHERELSATRGELEPKVAEARNLAGEIERLTSDLAATRAEHMRDLSERTELYKWEQQQAADTFAAQLAAAERKLESEKAAVENELATVKDTLGITERNASLREQLWEQTTVALRESQKKLQQELAETKERSAQADASKWAVEQRLVATLQQLEQLTESHRILELRVEAAETEARRNTLDRQRFAAYLEEGLAMVGALPPKPITIDPAPVRESASEVTVNDRPRRASENPPASRESEETLNDRPRRASANPPPTVRDSANEPTVIDRPRRASANPPAATHELANEETTERPRRASASPPSGAETATDRARRKSTNPPRALAPSDLEPPPVDEVANEASANQASANGPPANEPRARDSEPEMTVSGEGAPEAGGEPEALPNPPDPHNEQTRA